MTTIAYGSSVKETAKSRRHARRRAAAIERDNLDGVIDAAFGIRTLSAAEERERVAKRKDAIKKWAVVESGCSSLKVARAINGPSVRDVKEVEFVTREDPQYRKVKNPYGQHINARQKMRGQSIPLI
ncbi:hypothetical protein VRB80_13475 [Erwinia aphidicola]|uniref:transcriptional antitermination N peptide n=1 Tax=Erwinia aphidicola TaxID=68334 RepID=UPI0030CE3C6D